MAGLVERTTPDAAPAQEYRFEPMDPQNLYKHAAYSQVTVVSGRMRFVFVAGAVDRPLDYTPGSNRCEHNDWAGQYRSPMQKIEESLKATGATWDDVVFIRRFTVDVKKYLATVYDHWIPPTLKGPTAVEHADRGDFAA